MTPPPEPFRVLSMTVALQDPVGNGDRWLEVAFVDEGGGYFVEIKTCSIDDKGAFRMDSAELSRLAEWASNNCKALDRE